MVLLIILEIWVILITVKIWPGSNKIFNAGSALCKAVQHSEQHFGTEIDAQILKLME